MFINYVWNPSRPTPFNLVFVRIVLSVYAIWKLLSYGWFGLGDVPLFLLQSGPIPLVIPPEYLWLEAGVACVLLGLFGAGYRIRITAITSATLVGHLTSIHYTVTNQASTFLPSIYFLVLFAVYSEYADFSLHESQSIEPERYKLQPLRFGLLILALTYFFTGIAKVQSGVVAWASGSNIGRSILFESTVHSGSVTFFAEWLLANPTVLHIIGWSTVILEVGFLIVVLFRLPMWPFILGLISLHIGIALSMQIVFFDQPILFALFLPWDRIFESLDVTIPDVPDVDFV
jgi:hypothetical protein